MGEMLEATFVAEKQTKNTVRYQEESDEHPIIVTIYLQKSAVTLLGNPRRIKVTIEPL